MGYIDRHKHGSTLPYVTIDSPFGRQLKFLLDTGATHSFLDPKFTTSTNRIRLKTDFKIKTVLSEHTLKEKQNS